jgi:hypothetical protein
LDVVHDQQMNRFGFEVGGSKVNVVVELKNDTNGNLFNKAQILIAIWPLRDLGVICYVPVIALVVLCACT